jgi:hypothetical protein
MTRYGVVVDSIEELTELNDSWLATDYVAILTSQDVHGAAQIAPEELRDMCLFALQDLEPPAAAAILLKYKLGTRLSDGQIKNYSVDSQHERLWEQSADLAVHKPMFAVASLLNAVNSVAFPTPDALRVSLSIQCENETDLAIFNEDMDPALLVGMLSSGMDDSAILNRLFGDQIAAGKIADAASIIWNVSVDASDPALIRMKITSSAYWLNGLRETESFDWTVQ